MRGRLSALHASTLPGLAVEESDDWVGVRIKGQGCTALGMDALLALLPEFEGVRTQCSRLDFAWDHFPIEPRQVFDLLSSGDYRSRCSFEPDFQTNPTGDTTYTHYKPEKRGIKRYVRWYNMRGNTRCEIRLGDAYSKGVCSNITGLDVDRVHDVAMASLRGLLDITSPGERDKRPARRALHPDWKSFVGDADSWSLQFNRDKQEREGLERLGLYEGAVQRSAKRLYEGYIAYGSEWLIARVKHFGEAKAEQKNIDALRRIRSAAAANRVAGVPPWPDEYDAEVPI